MKPGTWQPPRDAWTSTNVGRFGSLHGCADLDELRDKSVADPTWFWDAVVGSLGVPFSTAYESVLDDSAGIPWTTWFNGGSLNFADACCDRWAAATPDAEALVWEGEEGATRAWTYAELRAEADGLAHLLADRGVGIGDAVGIFMPLLPETVAAVLAVAKLGAVFVPVFSGYGADAVRVRLEDAAAVALITADGFPRRTKVVPMLDTALAAAIGLPTLRTVVVVDRVGASHPDDTRVVGWPGASSTPFPTVMVDSEHTLFLAYTSGTTGRPKGVVHVHGGWTVKVAEEGAFQTDIGPGDRVFWLTDLGWIMGPWLITGALANGATMVLYDGAPDHPGPDRLWALLARHRATHCGISPTLVRALMVHGEEVVARHDLSALRILASTGEPWNEAPWHWYSDNVGGGRCPVINLSGGTEVGACFLSPHPVEPISPMSLGGPSLGVAVDVFDDSGHPLRGAVGELVCTRPWPGMTRGIYQDADRYFETYWSRWPDVWVHGDWASVDKTEEGREEWFLHGRSDDTIKVAGKRLGPAEVESALVSHPSVVEAAAVGLPDERKGEALWVFVVVGSSVQPTDDLRAELTDIVAERLGKSFRPSGVRFVRSLPKTRSAKVVRRVVRAVATGADPGDISSLEDVDAVTSVREAV
ncbi:MAG: AMP-binding protein [Acidimicrobiales bacterium]